MTSKVARALRWSAVITVALPLANAGAEPARPAPETTFRSSHRLVISFDRLFGFDYESRTLSLGGNVESDATTVSFFGSQPEGTVNPFTFPRLAADVILHERFTVGAAGSYFHASTPLGANGDYTQSGYLLAPRVGYLIFLGPDLALWPRAGVTFAHTFDGAIRTSIVDLTALTVEMPLLFSVSPHLAFSTALTIDRSATGTITGDLTGNHQTYHFSTMDVGLQAGISIVF